MNWSHIQEGMRLFKRRNRVKKYGLHKYTGDAKEICQKIVEDCWNKKEEYFQTSTNHGHFCEFYMRDFGWAVDSLVKLGHHNKVVKTLEYALNKYSNKHLTTTINPKGKCIDVFKYSPDSIAYLLYSLDIAQANELVEKYKDFLIKEVHKCFKLCFNPTTSLIREDIHFGSMKDSTNRNCSTYDNTMLAMTSEKLKKFSIYNPFEDYDIKSAMKENLWNYESGYWYDDIHKYDIVTGENNTFPYWTGIISLEEKASPKDDLTMVQSSIKNIQKSQLDTPFPLKYSNKKLGKEMFWRKWTVSDYQTHSIKTHMGGIYIHVVKKVYPELARKYIDSYKKIIEKHGTYLENFDSKGEPLSSRFYYSDEGNLWSANYLTLL